ncbi:hypothetical protein ABIF26_006437 [Bradyrhizobium elkanii]|uniref:phage terminase small subunit-related protein n=1 Tax=Bradyrhizobium elkanii TaxID=29448 RepID=UPI00351798B7
MRKLAKNSPKRSRAKDLYENSELSVREIAAKIKVDEKTVRNWSKTEEWERKSAEIPQPDSIGEVAERVVAQLDAVTSTGEAPLPSEIARRTCTTLDALRAHLDTVVQNLHLIRDLAEAETSGDGSPARGRLIEKVLSLPGLVKAANDLTSAVARLADAGPGKKEEAKDRAKAAGTGRFATPQAPKHAVDTTLQ